MSASTTAVGAIGLGAREPRPIALSGPPRRPVRRYACVVIRLDSIPGVRLVEHSAFQAWQDARRAGATPPPLAWNGRRYLHDVKAEVVASFERTRRPIEWAQVRFSRRGYKLYMRICDVPNAPPSRRDLAHAERVRRIAVRSLASILRKADYPWIADALLSVEAAEVAPIETEGEG